MKSGHIALVPTSARHVSLPQDVGPVVELATTDVPRACLFGCGNYKISSGPMYLNKLFLGFQVLPEQ